MNGMRGDCPTCEGLRWAFVNPTHRQLGPSCDPVRHEWIGPCPTCAASASLHDAAAAAGASNLVAWALTNFRSGLDFRAAALPWPFIRCVCPEYDDVVGWTYTSPDDGGLEKLLVLDLLESAEIIVSTAEPLARRTADDESASLASFSARVAEKLRTESVTIPFEVFAPIPGTFTEILVSSGATLLGRRRERGNYMIALEYAPATSRTAPPRLEARLAWLAYRWEAEEPTPFRRRVDPLDLVTVALFEPASATLEVLNEKTWNAWYGPLG